jgi:hypothetical protein
LNAKFGVAEQNSNVLQIPRRALHDQVMARLREMRNGTIHSPTLA